MKLQITNQDLMYKGKLKTFSNKSKLRPTDKLLTDTEKQVTTKQQTIYQTVYQLGSDLDRTEATDKGADSCCDWME